jgi:hypothetical protein
MHVLLIDETFSSFSHVNLCSLSLFEFSYGRLPVNVQLFAFVGLPRSHSAARFLFFAPFAHLP